MRALNKIRENYIKSTLAAKIRFFYIVLLLPLLIFSLILIYQVWKENRKYQDMMQSVMMASKFNLDFKKDFDYETYLVIVGNKSVEESDMGRILDEARQVLTGLEELTNDDESIRKLDNVKKYLSNLERYKTRIEENLSQEEKYEENMEIWENDVQIVTTLLREEFVGYIYSEVQKLQSTRAENEKFAGEMLTALLVTFAILTVALFYMSYYIPRTITRPIKDLAGVTDQIAKGDLSVRSDVKGGPEVMALQDSMNAMIDQINELISQVTKEQISLRKAEFQLLQSQINPHFLYNTLDAIIWLAEAGQREQVVSTVKSLSDFFRTSLNQGRDIIPLRDEIAHVRSYLQIQQMRYHDILTYEIDVPEDLYYYLIPKITIQPIVENALYHGIKNVRGGGSITVTGKKSEDAVEITVKDNGAGMTEERLAKVREGIVSRSEDASEIYGLYNVNERIKLHFGQKYGITIESSEGGGTVVTVLIPLKYSSEETNAAYI